MTERQTDTHRDNWPLRPKEPQSLAVAGCDNGENTG